MCDRRDQDRKTVDFGYWNMLLLGIVTLNNRNVTSEVKTNKQGTGKCSEKPGPVGARVNSDVDTRLIKHSLSLVVMSTVHR